MKVNSGTGWGGCGGGATTAEITISDVSLMSLCHTKAMQYPTGKTAVWKSDDQLKNCTEIKVNPKESKIYFTIKPTNKYNFYCIDEVAVILDDEQSTKYRKETDYMWRLGDSETFDLTKQ